MCCCLIFKCLEEREKKCEMLTEQLQEARNAIEENEALLKDVDARIIKSQYICVSQTYINYVGYVMSEFVLQLSVVSDS